MVRSKVVVPAAFVALVSSALFSISAYGRSFTSYPEMKIKREHVAGSADGNIKPEVELITEDTVKRMENPGMVEVCQSSGKNGKK